MTAGRGLGTLDGVVQACSDLTSILAAVADEASKTPWIDACVVFGSSVLARSGPQSDVDVGWVGDGAGFDDEAEFRRRLQRRLTRDLHLVHLGSAGILLRIAAVRDGVAAFERSPGSWARFAARAMSEWLDFAPFARRCAAGVRRAILNTGRPDG